MGVSVTRIVKYILKGDKGDSAVNYYITLSAKTFAADSTGKPLNTTENISVIAYKQVGNNSAVALSTANDDNWTISTYIRKNESNVSNYVSSNNDSLHIPAPGYAFSEIGVTFSVTINGTPQIYQKEIIQPLKQGAQGSVGAALRGPQSWSDCATGYSFQSGGQGDTWKDVVLYGDNYYSCVKNHTKTATNYPGSTEDSNNGYWQLGDKIELVATKILLATYALIKNLGVEAIDMKDSNGNVLFQAKNGNVTCKTGTFDDVTIQSGKIAGFKISGNGLTNDPFTNDAYVIFRNDTRKCFAGMGGNVLPASSGKRGVARFENEDDTDQWGLGSNIAAILSAKNAAYNFAFTGQGNGFLNGAIEGYMLNQFTPSSTINCIDVSKGKYVLILGTYGTCYLPTLSAIRSALGIGTSTNFALHLTVVAGSGASFTLFGYRDGSYEDSTCPHLRNENFGDVTGGIKFAQGDSMNLLLYYNGAYQAQIMNRRS